MAQELTTAKRRAPRQEADEWDHLSDEDLARLFDEGEPVHIRLRRPPPKTPVQCPRAERDPKQ